MLKLFKPRLSTKPFRKLKVHDEGKACVLDFGEQRVTIKTPRLGSDHRKHADFALMLAGAVGMTVGERFEVEAPVTKQAADNLNLYLFAWSVWKVKDYLPTEIVTPNIVPADTRPRTGGVFTLSGGVDSTYGVIRAKRELGLKDAVLIAGADYPSADHPGFRELYDLVKRTTDHLDLNLHVAETDARNVLVDWPSYHIALISAILRLTGSGLAWAGYAADVHDWGELTYAPGGNMRGFAAINGTHEFPFHYLGTEASRDMKLTGIAEAEPELLKNISVCWKDTSTGGNCGKCGKCVRTRVSLYAAGLEQTAIFDDDIDLVAAIEATPLPKKSQARLQQVRLDYYSLLRMPEGDVKTALRKKMREIAEVDGLYVGPIIARRDRVSRP